MICQIQKYLSEGCSYREISKRMGIGRNTIAKYRCGDPKELSKYGIRQSRLDPFHSMIMKGLNAGWSKSKTVKAVYAAGYDGSTSNAFDYLVKIEHRERKNFAPQPYVRTMTECLKYRRGSRGKEKDYVTREGIFRYIWMNTELMDAHVKYLDEKFPDIRCLHDCVMEFRNIFEKRSMPLLYLFIEKYKGDTKKSVSSFAKGLERDLVAVENAVASDYSNGFVEGTNSRLKMIKRTMYGRCGRELLEAKMKYARIIKYG